MSTSIRTFTLAVAATLAATVPGCPQGSGPQVDQILKLPESVWTNINRFVFLVAFDVYQPGVRNLEYVTRFSQLKSYAELRAACRQWGEETFPALQELAKQLAKDDIGNSLAVMKRASRAIAAGDSGLAGRHAEFDAQSAALERRFIELGKISEAATGQLERLTKASKAAIFEYRGRKFPITEFVEIGPDPDAVLTALRATDGRWKSLLSDIKELRRLAGEANSDKAEALYLDIGLDTWADIAKSAQGFMADVPRQRRYLSGDNYYDYCGPIEGHWYNIANLELSPLFWSKYLSASGGRLGLRVNAVRMYGHLNEEDLQWKFLKLGQGWWRVVNRKLGDASALDGGPGSASVVALGAFSGQSWRFLPAGKPGGCRLFNSYAGELFSLTEAVTNGTPAVTTVTLQPTTGGTNQQWQIEAAQK